MVLKFLPKMKVFYPWKRNLHNPHDDGDDVDHHRVHFVLHRAWQVVRWGIKTQPVELTSEKADKNRGKMRGKEVKRRSKSSYAPEWTNNVLTNHTQPQKGILNIKSQYIMLNVYFLHIAEIKKCCSLRICTEYWNGKRVGPPWPPTIRETRLGVTLHLLHHLPLHPPNSPPTPPPTPPPTWLSKSPPTHLYFCVWDFHSSGYKYSSTERKNYIFLPPTVSW